MSKGLLRRASGLAAGLVLLTASPALAHALNGASPSNYSTRILEVVPKHPGIDVKVVEAGNRLLLTNTSPDEVMVLGYSQEPYLRIGPDGVFENERSRATYLNRSRLPTSQLPAKASADPKTEPEWKKVSASPKFRWHDHRIHWMSPQPPGPVQANPGQEQVIIPAWEVPLVVGSEQILVKGDLRWVPGPSNLPWLAIAAVTGLAFAGVLLGPLSRRPRATQLAMVAALVVLTAFDAARLAGLASNTGSSFVKAASQNLPAVAAWLSAVFASVLLLRGDARVGPALAAGAGVLFAIGAIGDFNVLGRSQLATNAPIWLARLSVAAGLGLGLALLVAAFAPLLIPAGHAPVASGPSPQPVAAD
jgi:hypothetical protein